MRTNLSNPIDAALATRNNGMHDSSSIARSGNGMPGSWSPNTAANDASGAQVRRSFMPGLGAFDIKALLTPANITIAASLGVLAFIALRKRK
jgi:hypothetical protein